MKKYLVAAVAAWAGAALAAPIAADLILRDATVVDVAGGRLLAFDEQELLALAKSWSARIHGAQS